MISPDKFAVARCVLIIGFALLSPARARAGSLLDSQPDDGLTSYYSFRSPDGLASCEAADDIDVTGNINEVVVTGYQPNFPFSSFGGVYVRFYASLFSLAGQAK